MEFNAITQAMLEEYERQYFDVQNIRPGHGAVRYFVSNVQAAFDAKWIGEPFTGFADKSWKKEPASPELYESIKEMANAIDAKYSELTVIDPNG